MFSLIGFPFCDVAVIQAKSSAHMNRALFVAPFFAQPDFADQHVGQM